jgi:HNH endonuclease
MRSLAMRQQNYDLVGKCVYCLHDFAADDLTDEHIIPRAMNGGLILKKGACKPCAKRSNEDYEGAALNNDLLIARRILELRKSRNRGAKQPPPKPLPPVAAGDRTMGGGKFDIALSDDQYPNHFSLVLFRPAGLLVGEDRGADLKEMRLQIFNLGGHEKRATNVTVQQSHINGPFAKMLAKIAYCYAVAERGFNAFKGDDIRDLLMGRRDDVYNFVGNPAERIILGNQHLHALYFRERDGWLIVLVHLFASCIGDPKLPATPYEVVVGKIR